MISSKDMIDQGKVPFHIAIIMDGNGRWARQKGQARRVGHEIGVTSVKNIIEAASEIGIKYLTLYTFSTENWNRPKAEIETLMSLLFSFINSEIVTLKDNNVRLLTIGDITSLPVKVHKKINSATTETLNNTGLTLILALSYGSKQDIVNAIRLLCANIREGELSVSDMSEETFGKYLSTNGIPDPELLIRTGGEYRVSNFLLWEIAFAELYFTKTLWPDFNKEDFFKAVVDYQNREKRYGKISNQIIQN
jgi:undecaprenyl diphosphate synthase